MVRKRKGTVVAANFPTLRDSGVSMLGNPPSIDRQLKERARKSNPTTARDHRRYSLTVKRGISYMVAPVQRSGTHLLCSILRSTGMAGSPEEHFLSKPGETWEKRWGTPSPAACVQHVLHQNTGADGVFGTVVMWSYFERMLQMLQQIPEYKDLAGAELLETVFCEPKYIWMRRRNHVEQAVSWAIACQTGVWTQKAEEKSQQHAISKFDFKVIDEWCNRIATHDEGWANYFRENQIEPLVLF